MKNPEPTCDVCSLMSFVPSFLGCEPDKKVKENISKTSQNTGASAKLRLQRFAKDLLQNHAKFPNAELFPNTPIGSILPNIPKHRKTTPGKNLEKPLFYSKLLGK